MSQVHQPRSAPTKIYTNNLVGAAETAAPPMNETAAPPIGICVFYVRIITNKI